MNRFEYDEELRGEDPCYELVEKYKSLEEKYNTLLEAYKELSIRYWELYKE